MAGIIRADHDHRQLRRKPVNLSMLKSPEHILGPVRAIPQIEVRHAGKGLLNKSRNTIIHKMGNRIADQNQIDFMLLLFNFLKLFRMAVHPPVIARLRHNRLRQRRSKAHLTEQCRQHNRSFPNVSLHNTDPIFLP